MKKVHRVMLQTIHVSIMRASAPGEMTPAEALEFLEELQADIDGQVDCLRDKLRGGDGVDCMALKAQLLRERTKP
jgi:hypothetical protein